MFVGEYQNSIDQKFRMIIPAKYRDELGLKCYITKGNDNCLNIYTVEEWAKFTEKLLELPSGKAAARQHIRKFTANAVEADIDRQGRVTIPQKLRDMVGISKEVVTVGCINRIEVWSRGEWEKVLQIPDDEEYEEV